MLQGSNTGGGYRGAAQCTVLLGAAAIASWSGQARDCMLRGDTAVVAFRICRWFQIICT
jgi:hypothetical protein